MTDEQARAILAKLKHLHFKNVLEKSEAKSSSKGQLSFFLELVSDGSAPSQAQPK